MPPAQQAFRLTSHVLITNLLLLALALKVYPDHFSLVRDPLSWLGRLVAHNQRTNISGVTVFALAMAVNSVYWWQFRLILLKTRFGRRLLSRFLAWLVQAGLILMPLPCDHFVLLHSLGGGLVVGGLWGLAAAGLAYSHRPLGRLALLLQVGLHGAALYCFLHYIGDTTLKGFSQRPVLLMLLLVLLACTRVAPRQHEVSLSASQQP